MKPNQETNRMFSVEQSLIAALLVFEDATEEIIQELYPSHFENQKLGKIYEAMRVLANDGVAINPTTVGKKLRDWGRPNPDAIENYLHELWGSSGTAANAVWCSDEIQKAWQIRTAAEACNEAALTLRGEGADYEKIIDQLQGDLEDVVKCSQPRGPRPMGQDLKDSYAKSRQAEGSESVGGFSTGYSRLDWWTSGLQKSNLIVLAAQTGMGKTSLAMNIAANVAKADQGVVVIFSMEMGRPELAGRLVASEIGLDLRKLSAGKLVDEEWNRFEEAQQTLSPMADRLLLDVSGRVTPASIRASLRRIQHRNEIALVIVDYLQLCGTDERGGSLYERTSAISGALKAIAVDFDVPMLALSQLSREAARRNGEPRLSDLRDSGTIEQDANVVIFIQREKAQNEFGETDDQATIIIAKNRSGPTGKFKMHWEPSFVRFDDLTDRLDPEQGALL